MDDRTAKNLLGSWLPESQSSQTRRSRPRWPFGLAVVLLIAAAPGWWLYQRSPQPAQTTRPPAPPTSVVAAAADKGDINITLNGLGTVTSLATVTIRTQISGYLTRVAFEEGQNVAQGDLLAEIDSRPYEAALQQMQGQLARDQALLEGAKVDLARYQRLAATKAIPQQQLDTQQALVKQYEGQVAADEGQVNTAKTNLAYCRITAPVSGRIGLRQVDPGNYVSPGDQNGLVVITQLKPISVIFTIPEDNLPTILARLRAGATLPVTAFDRSGTRQLAKGELKTVDNQVDTTTGTLKLRAQFPNDDESLFPNQFVNVQLLVDVLHDTTVLPTAAIQRGSPGTFVYLVNPNNTVSVRVVSLGPNDGERVAVQSGLAPGDKVVVDGADKLREGARITVREPNNGSSTQPPATVGKRQGGKASSRDAP
jgi:membrane fusion protein, multidrug efflux system